MHTFRKYISNRGSALLMVISTMTALMITCMAMFFTVLASRSTTYAILNQKQAYQSSLSIFDMLMNDAQSDVSAFREKMLSMAVGDYIETSGTSEDLGDYTVSIKRLSDEVVEGTVNQVFDIVVSSTVNGVTETVHSQTNYNPGSPGENLVGDPSVSISPTFAATGYVPNDVYLDKGRFFSDVYFDNEVTYFAVNGGGEMHLYGDVNCAGSAIFAPGFQWNSRSGRPVTVAIRNTLTARSGANTTYLKGDKYLVGGDAYIRDPLQNTFVYINGDLHLDGDVGGALKDIPYFVNGDVYTDMTQLNNLYCNGTLYSFDGATNRGKTPRTWDDVAGTTINDLKVLSHDEMIIELDKRTQTNTYYKWKIDDDPASVDDKAVPDVNLDSSIGNHQKLTINSKTEPVYIVHEDAYNSSNVPSEYGMSDSDLDNKWKSGCVITDIDVNIWDGNPYFFIIIDTGDNPDNVYTIRVQGNTNGPKGNNKYFTWNGGSNVRPIILTKGRGSVVIDVPPGVIYQDVNYGLICHYNWWVLDGESTDFGTPNGNFSNNSTLISPETLKPLVHTTCGQYCTDGCNDPGKITVTDSEEVCSRDMHPAGVSKTKKTVKCSVHDVEVTYCPYCEELLVKDSFGMYNFCKDHVDKTKAAAALSSKPNANKATDGTAIIPNCNIYLISSDESSEFRFGRDQNEGVLGYNAMIGYVYAPYQTFSSETDVSGGYLNFMGGMTVSDYIFHSDSSFIMCLPDKNPADLMSDDSLKHRYTVAKDWKIELVTH